MRPRLKHGLETDETTLKTVYHGDLALRCEQVLQGRTGKKPPILATKSVRHGIREEEVVGESTGGDLIVIAGVTPTSYPASRIRIPERAVPKVRRVCHKANQFGEVEITAEIIPSVQSQYGWVPVYPHFSRSAVSKSLTYARCQGRNWPVWWI